MSMKISNDIIGNRTRDLPACSAVPQPTASPRSPNKLTYNVENYTCVLLNTSQNIYFFFVDVSHFLKVLAVCTSNF